MSAWMIADLTPRDKRPPPPVSSVINPPLQKCTQELCGRSPHLRDLSDLLCDILGSVFDLAGGDDLDLGG